MLQTKKDNKLIEILLQLIRTMGLLVFIVKISHILVEKESLLKVVTVKME
jgi:hypothetical protein